MQSDSAILREYLARMSALGISKRDRQRVTKLVSLCQSLPESGLVLAGERHLALLVRRKTFAYYLNDHHGDGRVCICCKSSPARQRELISRAPDRYFFPAYLGSKGWVSLRLDLPRIGWDEVFECVIEAYRLQAPRRLVADAE